MREETRLFLSLMWFNLVTKKCVVWRVGCLVEVRASFSFIQKLRRLGSNGYVCRNLRNSVPSVWLESGAHGSDCCPVDGQDRD